MISRRFFLSRSAGGIITAKTLGLFTLLGLSRKANAGEASIIDLSGDKYIQLGTGQVGRLIGITSENWNILRFGMRYTIKTGAAMSAPQPTFFFGLCNGTSNKFADATTTNAIGLKVAAQNWAFAGGFYSTANANPFTACTRIGSTVTDSAAFGGGQWYTKINADHHFFLTVTKGAPNYTVGVFFDLGGATDAAASTFRTQMITNPPSLADYTNASATIAFSEAVNPITALNIYWSDSRALFQITDLAIAKLA